jgi:hypothetical protein
MRFVKVLALIVGSVLLILVSMLFTGVLFQSLLGAAAVFFLVCSIGALRLMKHTKAPVEGDLLE